MGLVFDLNYASVVVAAVVGFIIGMLWYSPVLFGNTWMKLVGLSKKQLEKAQKEGMAGTMVLALVSVLVLSLAMEILINSTGITDLATAIFLAVILWLGLIATSMLNRVLWENSSVELYLINSTHYLVSLIIIAVIHVLM